MSRMKGTGLQRSSEEMGSHVLLSEMRGISLLPIIYVWIARDSRAGSLRNTGSVLQPSLCSLPEPYRVMFWGFPKIRGVNRLNEVKPPWGDAECSRPCPSEAAEHTENRHIWADTPSGQLSRKPTLQFSLQKWEREKSLLSDIWSALNVNLKGRKTSLRALSTQFYLP